MGWEEKDQLQTEVKHQVQPGQYLGVDTRSHRKIARDGNESAIHLRINSGRSRFLPADRIWFRNSKPASAMSNRYLCQRISKLSLQKHQRDCRITSPFKQWQQQPSKGPYHEVPEPGAALKDDVIEKIKKYKGLLNIEEDRCKEKESMKLKPTRQGRLQPLFGKPTLSGPTIGQCIGIQPRPRALGTIPRNVHLMKEELYSSNELKNAVMNSATDHRNFSIPSRMLSSKSLTRESERNLPLQSDLESTDVSTLEQTEAWCNNHRERGEECIRKENGNKYRVIHFAACNVNSDDEDDAYYEDDLEISHTFSIEIKKKTSLSKPEQSLDLSSDEKVQND